MQFIVRQSNFNKAINREIHSEDAERVNKKEWRWVISMPGGQDMLHLSEWKKKQMTLQVF